jgi:hypothetical protein
MIQVQMITPDGSSTIEVEDGWVSDQIINEHTGWEVKPEGFCQDDICIPAGAAANAGKVNLKAFAELTHRHLIVDNEENALSLGAPYESRGSTLTTLQAPDFELPDLDGTLHKLSDYRGKKILLAAYASW